MIEACGPGGCGRDRDSERDRIVVQKVLITSRQRHNVNYVTASVVVISLMYILFLLFLFKLYTVSRFLTISAVEPRLLLPSEILAAWCMRICVSANGCLRS